MGACLQEGKAQLWLLRQQGVSLARLLLNQRLSIQSHEPASNPMSQQPSLDISAQVDNSCRSPKHSSHSPAAVENSCCSHPDLDLLHYSEHLLWGHVFHRFDDVSCALRSGAMHAGLPNTQQR